MTDNLQEQFMHEELKGDVDIAIENLKTGNPEIQVFYNTCQTDQEPDYELIRKHIEQWVQRHPQETRDFMEYKKEVLRENFNEYGATKDGKARKLVEIPQGLYTLLRILAPNFLGAQEISAEEKKKRVRKFAKKFPAFLMCEKI
jgi:hypothetical protein